MRRADRADDTAAGIEGIREIPRAVKAISADMIRLVVVEARLFGRTALTMIGLTVAIALLLAGGWLFTGAALVMALASLHAFSAAGALLTVALVHVAVAALAFWRLRHITRDLTFRESRASVSSLLTQARSSDDASGPPPEQ